MKPRSDRMYVNCGACGHTWVGMHLPMEAHKAAGLMKKLACPNCAASGKKIFMATKEQALAFEAGGVKA